MLVIEKVMKYLTDVNTINNPCESVLIPWSILKMISWPIFKCVTVSIFVAAVANGVDRSKLL